MQEQSTQTTLQTSITAQVITVYCLCDDFLRAVGHRDDPQAKMTTAQVMTVALVAAALFDGNHDRSRRFLQEHGYIRGMLSKSRFNRRWHAIPEALWQQMLWLLGQAAKACNPEGVYAVDSVPIPVCDNIRRCRLYPCPKRAKGQGTDRGGAKAKGKARAKARAGDPHRGYCASKRRYYASKRRYYYGLKGHLLVTATGQPVEFVLTPAAAADIEGLRMLDLDLPAGATVAADAAYTDYAYEDLLRAQEGVDLLADRKCNSLRPHPAHRSYLCQQWRKRIETTFSTLTGWLGRRLHAVTPQGYERKVFLTVLAYAIVTG